MSLVRFIVFACLIASGCAQAADAEQSVDLRYYPPYAEKVDPGRLPRLVNGLQSGTPFLKARRRILAQGWRPADRRDASIEEASDCGLLDCQLHRRGVIEVDSCSLDRSVCTFYYRKGKRWLQIMALGESLPELLVYYWAALAPEPLPR